MDNTLLAALIGAAVASIGVTLAKDTKVSEFRQAWIDALRADVAEFLSLVARAFAEAHSNAKKQNIDDLQVVTDRMNTVMYRIIMRLDLKDIDKKPFHPQLLLSLSTAQSLVTDKTATREQLSAATSAIWIQTSDILDTAWERVKAGEPRYRRVLWAAYTVLALCIAAFGWQTFDKLRHSSQTPVTHVVIEQPVRVEERTIPAQSPTPPTQVPTANKP